MPLELVASLLTFAGILISVLVSFLVSSRQVRGELESMRYQAAQSYTGKLYERRIELYPQLYEILSRFAKRVNEAKVSPDELREFAAQINEWDSKYALFCSALTVRQLMSLRRALASMQKLEEASLSRRKLRKELIPLILELELALKTEIGVFEADSYHSPQRVKYLRDVLHEVRTAAQSDDLEE